MKDLDEVRDRFLGGRGRTRGLLIASALIWAVWCSLSLGRPWSSWSSIVHLWQTGMFDGVWTRRLLGAIGRHGITLAAALAFTLSLHGAGAKLLELLGPRSEGRVVHVATSLLLGFVIVGTAFLAMALVGLFFPSVMLTVAGVMFTMGRPIGLMRACRRSLAAGLPSRETGLKLVAFVPLGVCVSLILLPDTNGDAFSYHLAAPEQFLRLHRFAVRGTPFTFHYPLVTEFCDGLAVAWGRDAFAHLIQLIPYAAAVSILVSWCAARGGPFAGWIMAWWAVVYVPVLESALVAKNDLAAAAFPLAGACWLAGAPRRSSSSAALIGAMLLGSGVATKYSDFMPLALGGVVVLAREASGVRVRPRIPLLWAAVALVPWLPWLVKNDVLLGDPIWPQSAALFGGAFWERESAASLKIILSWGGVRPPLWTSIPALVNDLVRGQVLIAVLLPLALLRAWSLDRAVGLMGLLALAGALATWGVWPVVGIRYALPEILMLAACIAIVAARASIGWNRAWRRIAVTTAVGLGYLQCGGVMESGVHLETAVPTLTGVLSEPAFRRDRLSSYDRVVRDLGGVSPADGILIMGTVRTYRLPGRRLAERIYGRSWGWDLATRCASPGDIAKKVRQLNGRFALYDFAYEFLPNEYAPPFAWTGRMVRVWRGYVERYLDLIRLPPTADFMNGGYCVYRVRKVPRPTAPPSIPYLPGLDSLYDRVARVGATGDGPGWLKAAGDLDRSVPNVDSIRSLVGLAATSLERWRLAYDAYRPGVEHGMLAVENVWGMAEAAERLERWRAARDLYQKASVVFPYMQEQAIAKRDEMGRRAGGGERANR